EVVPHRRPVLDEERPVEVDLRIPGRGPEREEQRADRRGHEPGAHRLAVHANQRCRGAGDLRRGHGRCTTATARGRSRRRGALEPSVPRPRRANASPASPKAIDAKVSTAWKESAAAAAVSLPRPNRLSPRAIAAAGTPTPPGASGTTFPSACAP